MKKFLISFLSILILTVLVACGQAKDSLDGEYYYITDSGETYLELVIDGQGGRYYGEAEDPVTSVDNKNKTFSFSHLGREFMVTYELSENGILEIDTGSFYNGGNEITLYKKDSSAYNEKVK